MKRAAIALIFRNRKKEVLLLKRRDVAIWVFPGGGIEEGETAEEAVIRETREETGLTVKIVRKAAEYVPINRLTSPTTVFECEPLEGSLQTGPETRDIGFYPIDLLPSPSFFLHREWMKDALSHPAECLHKPIRQATYGRAALYFFLHPIQTIRFAFSVFGRPINS